MISNIFKYREYDGDTKDLGEGEVGLILGRFVFYDVELVAPIQGHFPKGHKFDFAVVDFVESTLEFEDKYGAKFNFYLEAFIVD